MALSYEEYLAKHPMTSAERAEIDAHKTRAKQLCDDAMIESNRIDAAVVSRLIANQFPQWARLPVRPVARQGWDNRTFRIGSELSARLPSAASYEAAVVKEARALKFLNDRLPVDTPQVLALGEPGGGYPFEWSVRSWLRGGTVADASLLDQNSLAADLGTTLRVLRSLPTDAGVAAGRHSFYRGCHPSAYGDEVQVALEVLRDRIDVDACERLWRDAMRSAWEHDPVWFHGDLAAENLLVEDGKLSALIDFGQCGVGDPACDLTIAWTYFDDAARAVFREAADLDDATWLRGRGWTLWKALITLAGNSGDEQAATQQRALDRLLRDVG